MARIRNYDPVVAAPGGRSFYSSLRKRSRAQRAPITPALKESLKKQRVARRAGYTLALKDAREAVFQQATQLRESFGGHSTEYYTQEILQRGQLERGRRKPSRWNAYLHHELKTRSSGTETIISYIPFLNYTLQSYLLASPSSSQTILSKKFPKSGM